MANLIPLRISQTLFRRLMGAPSMIAPIPTVFRYGTQTQKQEISLNNQYLECYIKILGRRPNIDASILKQLQALDTFVNKGPCSAESYPKGAGKQEIADWNQWKSVGNLTAEEAKLKYIEIARSCLSKFEEESPSED